MKYQSIVSIALLAVWSGCGFAAQPGAEQPSVLVTVTAIRQGNLPHTITAYGAVLSLPSARHVITAQTSETVGDVYAHEGDEVAPGAPLLQLIPGAQTAAAYTQAQSALRDAEQLVARTRDMLGQHLATAQQLANALKARSDARAALGALKAQGAAGTMTLRAPFRAIVSRLSVSPGMFASNGTPLIDLIKADDLTLRVGVTPPEAMLVNAGNAAQVTALVGRQDVTGVVSHRSSIIDPSTGLVPVDISLPADKLIPGEAAKAVITVGQTRGYVVPHAAILVDPHGKSYVVQVDGKKARKVPVLVAGTHDDKDAIRGSGLRADQLLVLNGNYQLDDGANIRLGVQHDGSGK